MKVFGLTGGIGMGKSAAAKLLAERGVAVIDTDLIARQAVEPGEPALRELAVQFGEEVIGSDGGLIREKLAQIVFADPESRRKLEAILHPRIRSAWLRQLELSRGEGASEAVVVIPLLFETNAAVHFDATVCVACSARTQEERLKIRGWTLEGGLQVHAAQLRRII
jgi:dephospho-CoA kinase